MVLTTPESIIEQASTQNLLDDLIDESVRTSARRPIIMQFDPSSGWIWRRWRGTVFSETWRACVKNVIYALAVYLIFRIHPNIKVHLSGFGSLWAQLLSVTTFTLTFFVNQSYALWRTCTQLSRRLQGRLHDIGLNCATHAARNIPSNPDDHSTYTDASRQVLELMSRYIRLFNIMTYASFTRSHRPILTPRGMRRLVERGLMTAQEREVLVEAAIPATQRHCAILMWMMRLFVEAREAGHIEGGSGFEQQTIEKFHVIRSQFGAIGDELQGRMPLAYAHIVQVLVDVILWMYPIMALSSGMSPFLTIIGTGLLTTSYQGLFDLAKQFLDPYDNENYGKGEDPLSVDTLIAETNAGSVRWMYAFEEMPFSAQRLRDGKLHASLLPAKGYSVEELAQKEEERIRKERELEEQRFKEEAEKEKQNDSVSLNGDHGASHEEHDSSRCGGVSGEKEVVANGEVSSLYDGTVIQNKNANEQQTAVKGDVVDEVKITSPTREEHKKQLAEVEKEILETQAILNAAPGADFIDWMEKEEERQAINQTAADAAVVGGNEKNATLDALEMDVDEDDMLYIEMKPEGIDGESVPSRNVDGRDETLHVEATLPGDTTSIHDHLETEVNKILVADERGSDDTQRILTDNCVANDWYERKLSEEEREIIETEAILSAAPGFDCINWKEEERERQALANRTARESVDAAGASGKVKLDAPEVNFQEIRSKSQLQPDYEAGGERACVDISPLFPNSGNTTVGTNVDGNQLIENPTDFSKNSTGPPSESDTIEGVDGDANTGSHTYPPSRKEGTTARRKL